jgi:inner membrane protein
MASAFSHALVTLAFGTVVRHSVMKWHVLLLGTLCAVVPDVDVIGFYFGIRYGNLWGHRGLTHSFFFAGLVSAILVGLRPRRATKREKAGCLYISSSAKPRMACSTP